MHDNKIGLLEKISNWFGRLLNLVTFIGVICALVGLYFTYGQVRIAATVLTDTRNTQSAQFMLDLEEKLHSGTNKVILHEIDDGTFKADATSTQHDLDDYLMKYEMIDNAYDHGLINENMMNDAFSYDIERAWCNDQVQKYIQQVRKDTQDQGLYGGVEDLFKRTEGSCY